MQIGNYFQRKYSDPTGHQQDISPNILGNNNNQLLDKDYTSKITREKKD